MGPLSSVGQQALHWVLKSMLPREWFDELKGLADVLQVMDAPTR